MTDIYDYYGGDKESFMERLLRSMEHSNGLPPFEARQGRGKKPVAVRKPPRSSEGYSETGLLERETLKGQWRHMKKACREKQKKPGNEEKWAWKISPMEWMELWGSCRKIAMGDGSLREPHLLRGRNPATDVQLRRKDTSKPWTKDNMDVMYKGQSLIAE